MASTTKVSHEVNNNHQADPVDNVSNLLAKISVDEGNATPVKIINVDTTGNGDEYQKGFDEDAAKYRVDSSSVSRPSVRITPRRRLLLEASGSRDGKRMRDRPRGGRGKGKNGFLLSAPT